MLYILQLFVCRKALFFFFWVGSFGFALSAGFSFSSFSSLAWAGPEQEKQLLDQAVLDLEQIKTAKTIDVDQFRLIESLLKSIAKYSAETRPVVRCTAGGEVLNRLWDAQNLSLFSVVKEQDPEEQDAVDVTQSCCCWISCGSNSVIPPDAPKVKEARQRLGQFYIQFKEIQRTELKAAIAALPSQNPSTEIKADLNVLRPPLSLDHVRHLSLPSQNPSTEIKADLNVLRPPLSLDHVRRLSLHAEANRGRQSSQVELAPEMTLQARQVELQVQQVEEVGRFLNSPIQKGPENGQKSRLQEKVEQLEAKVEARLRQISPDFKREIRVGPFDEKEGPVEVGVYYIPLEGKEGTISLFGMTLENFKNQIDPIWVGGTEEEKAELRRILNPLVDMAFEEGRGDWQSRSDEDYKNIVSQQLSSDFPFQTKGYPSKINELFQIAAVFAGVNLRLAESVDLVDHDTGHGIVQVIPPENAADFDPQLPFLNLLQGYAGNSRNGALGSIAQLIRMDDYPRRLHALTLEVEQWLPQIAARRVILKTSRSFVETSMVQMRTVQWSNSVNFEEKRGLKKKMKSKKKGTASSQPGQYELVVDPEVDCLIM